MLFRSTLKILFVFIAKLRRRVFPWADPQQPQLALGIATSPMVLDSIVHQALPANGSRAEGAIGKAVLSSVLKLHAAAHGPIPGIHERYIHTISGTIEMRMKEQSHNHPQSCDA